MHGIDLNHLFILECLNEGTDIEKHVNSSKLKAWKQNLYRKSLITPQGEVSETGKELLKALREAKPVSSAIISVKKKMDEGFDLWWRIYPTTDMFDYKGKHFDGSRGLRVRKEECRVKFNAILLEGEFKVEDMIRCLELEVIMKKEQSFKENDNKMKYMQNSLTYLNQRTFENFNLGIHNLPKTNGSSSTVDI